MANHEIVKAQERTLARRHATISVVIPAHNEEENIAQAVEACQRGLALLEASGEVVVSASGCTDKTAICASNAGARVIEAPIGKGAAIKAGFTSSTGEIVCLVDGDLQYYGEVPLVTLLVEPLLHGIADATISNLYWRPIYPDQWMHGFFAPLVGHIFPELLPKAGSTPWSGQRAAIRSLWPSPDSLPDDFTVDLALLLAWSDRTSRLRPVLTDDWFNPIRPKPEQMALDYKLLVQHGIEQGRIGKSAWAPLNIWFARVEQLIANYNHGFDDPIEHEHHLLAESLTEFQRQMHWRHDDEPEDDSRC